MFDELLRELRRDEWFQAAVAANQLQERRAAAVAEVALRDDLAAALARLGICSLFTHQAEVLRHVRAGVVSHESRVMSRES